MLCVISVGDIDQAMGAGGKLSGQLSVVASVVGLISRDIEQAVFFFFLGGGVKLAGQLSAVAGVVGLRPISL